LPGYKGMENEVDHSVYFQGQECHTLNVHTQRQLYAHHCLWIMITQMIQWLITDWITGVQCPVQVGFSASPAHTHKLQGPPNLSSMSNKWSFSGYKVVRVWNCPLSCI